MTKTMDTFCQGNAQRGHDYYEYGDDVNNYDEEEGDNKDDEIDDGDKDNDNDDGIKDISQPLRACLNFSSGKRKTNISLPANWPRLPVEKHATQKAEDELYVFFGKRFRIESRKSVKKALKKRGSTTYRVSQKNYPSGNSRN